MVFSAAICARTVSLIARPVSSAVWSHDRFGRATSPGYSSLTCYNHSGILAVGDAGVRPRDLRDLGQALVGGHQVGRQGVGAGKAMIELVNAGTGVRDHPAAARLRYSAPFWGDPPGPPLRSIQPRTVSGSLSSSRAMSSSGRPSACRRAASAWRLRYALVRHALEQNCLSARPRPGATSNQVPHSGHCLNLASRSTARGELKPQSPDQTVRNDVEAEPIAILFPEQARRGPVVQMLVDQALHAVERRRNRDLGR